MGNWQRLSRKGFIVYFNQFLFLPKCMHSSGYATVSTSDTFRLCTYIVLFSCMCAGVQPIYGASTRSLLLARPFLLFTAFSIFGESYSFAPFARWPLQFRGPLIIPSLFIPPLYISTGSSVRLAFLFASVRYRFVEVCHRRN